MTATTYVDQHDSNLGVEKDYLKPTFEDSSMTIWYNTQPMPDDKSMRTESVLDTLSDVSDVIPSSSVTVIMTSDAHDTKESIPAARSNMLGSVGQDEDHRTTVIGAADSAIHSSAGLNLGIGQDNAIYTAGYDQAVSPYLSIDAPSTSVVHQTAKPCHTTSN
ncbi:uncharacterized protein M421DRAFT_93355 [Didymella exigua CBS 183.55]|uniref:Uncharacterized protein n=1 Tax=Didymella exigua CBS 183.55 TaxID=1150837 RepID=A0A6A5RFK6_9PLEO|nr:uncharacterized protein M421DRAFT_93355 [Didymella exigua CBS 183.55]KAF1927081.1 hypothetical protein M421DRAFT_93355 [Didymella exigua CBS 183.55]